MKRIIAAVSLALLSTTASAADDKVIASIKPLHSLVAAVMEGTGDSPMLLVEGSASPHTYSLKPSQAAALQKADIIFTIGDDFEIFLKKTLSTLPKNIPHVALDKEVQLTFFDVRTGGVFEAHEHEGEAHNEHEHEHEHEREHEHEHEKTKKNMRDLHYWLFSENARKMVMEIARQLAIVYPDKRKTYLDNARKITSRMKQVQTDISVRMIALQGKPFIVFHDATQYFENDHGLSAQGAIMLHAGEMPGAKRIKQIRDKIKTLDAVCVFSEPSFDGKVVENLLQGTKAKSGVLDAEGALLEPGAELYFQLIEGIAKSLENCLAA
jgi:zinc transport system substrate-binding protein